MKYKIIVEEFALHTRSKVIGIIKKFSALIILCAILFVFSPDAFSVNVDGIDSGVEWDEASVDLVFNGESNCLVNYAIIKNFIAPEEKALYLCFMFCDPMLEPDNTEAGIFLALDSSDSFEINVASSPFHDYSNDFSFDGVVSVDENHGATCEIRLGFKNDLPRKISFDVRFIDSSGEISNVYPITVVNNYYSEPTELIINEPQTTKRYTYDDYEDDDNNKNSDYTLKRQTTKSVKKTTKFYIQTSPPYSYVRKTKAPKTTVAVKSSETSTSKVRKTKSSSKKATKETVVSYVYINETEQQTDLTLVTEINSSTDVVSTNALPTENKTVALSKGTKYKIIIGIFAAVSFTVIAAASTVSARKNSSKDENSDSR